MSMTAVAEKTLNYSPVRKIKQPRIEAIDLLRGTVMIIMALDHVRDYFHRDAFVFQPEDLGRTNVVLFFTRWITHFCAPVFVFLAGTAAYLYGSKRSTKELSVFLFTRGLWLLFVELFILSFFRTFNPAYTYVHLQVIWVIGLSMMILSAAIYLNKHVLLLCGLLMILSHNLLDSLHVTGTGSLGFVWSLLHEPGHFLFGNFSIYVHYPLIPWAGVMMIGFCFGQLYTRRDHQKKRKNILRWLGATAIGLFIILRSGNFYGDAAHWSVQNKFSFSLLSFLNVTKYPPSLLYLLLTLGPAMIFLSLAEKPLNTIKKQVAVIGRVPMFYYLAHILLIHVFATIAAYLSGYKLSDMVLSTSVQAAPLLKGYGFNLFTVYLVWAGLVIFLYPFCKWFDDYKRTHLPAKKWLSYL